MQISSYSFVAILLVAVFGSAQCDSIKTRNGIRGAQESIDPGTIPLNELFQGLSGIFETIATIEGESGSNNGEETIVTINNDPPTGELVEDEEDLETEIIILGTSSPSPSPTFFIGGTSTETGEEDDSGGSGFLQFFLNAWNTLSKWFS